MVTALPPATPAIVITSEGAYLQDPATGQHLMLVLGSGKILAPIQAMFMDGMLVEVRYYEEPIDPPAPAFAPAEFVYETSERRRRTWSNGGLLGPRTVGARDRSRRHRSARRKAGR